MKPPNTAQIIKTRFEENPFPEAFGVVVVVLMIWSLHKVKFKILFLLIVYQGNY